MPVDGNATEAFPLRVMAESQLRGKFERIYEPPSNTICDPADTGSAGGGGAGSAGSADGGAGGGRAAAVLVVVARCCWW